MSRLSVQERDYRACVAAARAMFGCGNGGRDFDESMDPTEMVSVLSEEERDEIKHGLHCPCYFSQMVKEEEIRKARTRDPQVYLHTDLPEDDVSLAEYLRQEEQVKDLREKEKKRKKRARYKANKAKRGH